MISRLLAALAVALPVWAAASAPMEMPSRTLASAPAQPMAFRAPSIVPVESASLPAFEEKVARASPEVPSGRLRVATVRALPKVSQVATWTPVAGGYVARLRAFSEGALGLRVKLELGSLTRALEARVQGSDGRIEFMRIDPSFGSEAWLPWTEGASQVVELFSTALPREDAVRLSEILHFTESPFAKAAGSCTVPTLCTTNDAVMDAAIAERKKSVFKLTFVEGGSGFACTGTLINTERFPTPFILTANHCIDNVQSASSVNTFWFFENPSCGDTSSINSGMVQLSGGTVLVFTNSNVDSSLLRMNDSPPPGATYSSWSRTLLDNGSPIVSLSHPKGDTSRYALGSVTREYRVEGHSQDMYGVAFTRGIIEGGSSGSGLFTMSGGTLQLRGILSGTTIRLPGGMSCTNLNEEALYGRFEVFQAEIDQYIRTAPQAADDAPNRALDLFGTPLADPNGVDRPLNLRTAALVIGNRRIDYPGDIDVYRFSVTAQTVVTIGSEGTLDTVGSLLDSRGVTLEANDDVASGNLNFGITRSLSPGTYYIEVGHWDPAGTGAYGLRFSTGGIVPGTGPNYTDLWWDASEPGWGVNVNHQGDILFATLFTYDLDGLPMWLIMSHGDRQADGSWSGTLYRTRGPAFNASPWPTSGITYDVVGNMTFSFVNANIGTLVYSVNGSQVTKTITRLPFATPVTCTWTTTDRNTSTNYQDLWWNPNESGWGINVTHQGDILFATLFTYDATGKGLWLVMSHGGRTGPASLTYTGILFRTTGPMFNSTNWSATPINYTNAGNMSLTFFDGNSGVLSYDVFGVPVTKAITRLTFAAQRPTCS